MVFDQNRQEIAGASVKLFNTEKGFSRIMPTNENGAFIFPSIQPGSYILEIEMRGFKKFIQTNIRAVVDTPTNVSAILEIGDISESVIVRNDGVESLINTQNASTGNHFTANQVTQLPTEAREVINLLTLQPGVTRFGFVAGGRSDQANITLDGVDVNDPVTGNIFTPVLRLNTEAIEEFRVTTTSPTASQGHSSGAQISLVTKSGTNDFHGAIFLAGRRTAWTANDFFNNRAGVERPKLDRNIFGGAIGGAIVKNRAFFFYSFEGERTTQGETILRVVPLENLGQGIVRFRQPNGQISALNCLQIAQAFSATNGCNSSALAVFADVAARYRANSFEIGDGLNTGGFRFNAENKIRKNSHVFRLDFNFSEKQQVFFRASVIRDYTINSPQFPDAPAPASWSHPAGFAAGHNWTVSKNVFNNFRFGLTRDAFTNYGDSKETAISFVNVYVPRLFVRGFSSILPVFNTSDDLTSVRGNHTLQFGVNFRFARNRLESFARSFDTAAVNAAQFQGGANFLTTRLQDSFGFQFADPTNVQNAVTAVIGRFSAYTARFAFERDGNLQSPGTPRLRDFRNADFEFYAQDIFKIRQNIMLTAGLRYNLSRPIFEANGFEIKPTTSLDEYFERRAQSAANGMPFNDPIILDLSGRANGKTPLYRTDKNNFQPRIALAWSPKSRFFGKNSESVIRGGLAVTNDSLGQVLMVTYESQNTLGFLTNQQIRRNLSAANLAPLFTGFSQSVRNLPNIISPNLSFPFRFTASSPTSNQIGFDENLLSPIHYSWNLTFERVLPAGLVMSVSYLGRKAENLLQTRDAAQIADFVDTQSGTDWFTAAAQLEILRQQNTPVSQISQIPYFANLFPANLSAQLNCSAAYNQTQAVYALVFRGAGSCGNGTDWTGAQLSLSLLSSRFPGQHIFFQPQFGSYAAWSSIGKSDYHGLSFSVRQRLGTRLTMDLNYTFSKSSDTGSSLQNSPRFSNSSFVINPFKLQDSYAVSDFDMRHIINANWIFKLPLGRGEAIFGEANKFADLILGGWQMSGIFRYNSGLPISAPLDNGGATNWAVKSYATRISDLRACPTRGGSLFGCNPSEAYRSFRNAYPGETGERNVFRLPSFWSLDLGFGKRFNLPWENHALQFRWEIFNFTNTQKMGEVGVDGYAVGLDPQTSANAPANFANFIRIQGSPRSMQFVLRYSF